MKKIDFKTKEAILNAVNKLADAVGSTLGAGGRNVLFQIGRNYAITKDGVTVAKQIEFEDESENAVAQIVKDAAARTARQAGDGTTTSTILVAEIVNAIMDREDFDTLNVTRVRKGIEDAAAYIVRNAEEGKKTISTDEEIKSIAAISGNNDPVIGQMMLDVYKAVGREGAVRIEETELDSTVFDVSSGVFVESGFINANFINSPTKRVADYEDVIIFLTDKRFEKGIDELAPALELMIPTGKPMLIICGGMEGEPLGTLTINKAQGRFNVVAVQAPYFGSERVDALDDIAAATGAQVVSEARGYNLNELTEDMFGTADRIIVDEHTTTILGRHGSEEAIQTRVDYIKEQQKEDRDGLMAFRLNQRLASLTAGVGVIYAGGKSEAEMKDMFFRLEDALSATKAALNSGYVVGGGMAYFNAADKGVDGDDSYALGYNATMKAAKKPVEWIIANAGFDPQSVIGQLGEKGFNAISGELEDLEEAGIIDPFQVLRSAISNAASVAGMLITTNVIITDEIRRR